MRQSGLFDERNVRPSCVLFVLLNPSTADATRDDQTTRKGMGFCRAWTCAGPVRDDPIVDTFAVVDSEYRYLLCRTPASGRWRMRFVNLFAFRATKPEALIDAALRGVDIVGPENDAIIRHSAADADRIVLAWGSSVAFGPRAPAGMWERDRVVLDMLSGHDLWCFGRSKSGDPLHPRTLAYSTPLVRY